MKPAMNHSNGGAHIDARLHRPAFVLDDSCADEGAWLRANAAADAPDLYAPAPRIPHDGPPPAGPIYWLVVVASLVSFAVFIGWHVLASWGPEIAKALGVAS